MKNKKSLKVIISIDVEEEGLFFGKYTQKNSTVNNVKLLPTLQSITTELNYPLTLLCTYAVFSDSEACKTLTYMRDKIGSEIGAHLHHWNTPPFDSSYNENNIPQRTHELEQDLLRNRLKSLLKVGKIFQGTNLTSFRMGRWDLKSKMLPMLANEGILVDSSTTPLRHYLNGADHFLTPVNPYWAQLNNNQTLLEVPITQIAYLPSLAKLWYKMGKKLPLNMQNYFIDKFRYFGALSVNPVWHSSWAMKMATKLHIARGGQVINLFWHSSEMMPGASPNTPDQNAADTLIKRAYAYLEWLKEEYQVQGLTLTDLSLNPVSKSFKTLPTNINNW